MATKPVTSSTQRIATPVENKKPVVRNLHIVPQTEGWGIRTEGSTRLSSIYNTQKEAIEAGRALAQRKAITLVIHGRDGRVKARNSFGSDPIGPPEPRQVLFPTAMPQTASRDAIKKAVADVISQRVRNGKSAKGSKAAARTKMQNLKTGSKLDSRH